MVHIFYSNTKTLKIPSKAETNATDVTMGLNDNSKAPGETNNNEFNDNQHTTAPENLFYTMKSR